MISKKDMAAYQERWKAVAEFEKEELRNTSIEIKWQQLNSIINLAARLGIFRDDPSEVEVQQRWANLKENFEKTVR